MPTMLSTLIRRQRNKSSPFFLLFTFLLLTSSITFTAARSSHDTDSSFLTSDESSAVVDSAMSLIDRVAADTPLLLETSSSSSQRHPRINTIERDEDSIAEEEAQEEERRAEVRQARRIEQQHQEELMAQEAVLMEIREKRHQLAQKRAAEEAKVKLDSLLQIAAQSRNSVQSQWRSSDDRSARSTHRRHRHPVREERERAAQEQLQEERYRVNLKNLEKRHQQFAAQQQQAAGKQANQLVRPSQQSASSSLQTDTTHELAAVESLLTQSTPAPLVLSHTNDVTQPLTMDLLHGTGLNNEANRRATQAGLQATQTNHPVQPSLEVLPQQQANSQQPQSSSFVSVHESRPAAMGPTIRSLPEPDHASEESLSSTSTSRDSVNEFLRNLPPAFMELDAATQMKILEAADDDRETHQQEKHQQKHQQKHQSKKSHPHHRSSSSKHHPHSSLSASELSAAASTVSTLSQLQKETKVSFAELVHLLAKPQQQDELMVETEEDSER